jgi:hypothetical protein
MKIERFYIHGKAKNFYDACVLYGNLYRGHVHADSIIQFVHPGADTILFRLGSGAFFIGRKKCIPRPRPINLDKLKAFIESSGAFKLTTSVIGYKAAYTGIGYRDIDILRVRIPIGAAVHTSVRMADSVFPRGPFEVVPDKCRASQAFVMDAWSLEHEPSKAKNFFSSYNKSYHYKLRTYAQPDCFEDTAKSCANGIHFFLTFEEAVKFATINMY